MAMDFEEFYQNGRAWARRFEAEGVMDRVRFERAFAQLTARYDSARIAAIVAVLFPVFSERFSIPRKEAMALAVTGGDYIHLCSYYAEIIPAYMSGVTPAQGAIAWVGEQGWSLDNTLEASSILAKHSLVFSEVVSGGILARSREHARPAGVGSVIANSLSLIGDWSDTVH